MKLELVPHTSPILRRPTLDFDFENPPYNTAELVRAMSDVLYDNEGLGLAAPQVGIPYAMFIVRGPLAFFNPSIIGVSRELIRLDEGCLSYPGLTLSIERPRHVRIRYTDHVGETFTQEYTGLTARCILHEMDHLDGILFSDRVSKLKLERGIKKAKKHAGRIYGMVDFSTEVAITNFDNMEILND